MRTQRLLLGEKLSAQLTDVGINDAFAPHPSKIKDFCHLRKGWLATGKHIDFKFAALCNTPEGEGFVLCR